MRVFIKRQVAIELDGAPIKMLKEIESTREKIRELESHEKIITERLNQSAGESSWLRRQLSSGELILKDAPKIDECEKDVALHQASLKRIAKDLKKNRLSLVKLIEAFNRQWVGVQVDEEIR